MNEARDRATQARQHCGYCGSPVQDDTRIERFGERFCSDAHADEFVTGVRAARIQAATRSPVSMGCGLPAGDRRTWKDYLKRGACWGAPLLLLLAIPLFWSGGATGAAGGSLLSLLGVVACPVGMYFMMRSMGGMNSGHMPRREDSDDGAKKNQ